MNREQGQEGEGNLQKFFGTFNQATTRLEGAFAGLEKQHELMNRELSCKNAALQTALAEREGINEYLRTVMESLSVGVVVTDRAGTVTMMNGTAERLTGCSRADVMGTGAQVLFDWGDRLDALFSAGDAGRRVGLKGRILHVSASTVKSAHGTDMGKVIVLRDVTQIAGLEQGVNDGEASGIVEDMTAHIAHEIRSPLGSIELFASLLMKELREEKHRERAAHIISAVRDMDHRVSALCDDVRDRTPLMGRVNLHGVLQDMLIFFRQVLDGGSIRLTVNYEEIDPVIAGNDAMVRQVCLNLILNALQAMPDGGDLCIETAIGECTARGDSQVTIRVTDNGCGIPARDINGIFDPFYTTKEGRMGLGLAIVKDIVDTHGGTIDAAPNEGGGSVFTMTFPLIASDRL